MEAPGSRYEIVMEGLVTCYVVHRSATAAGPKSLFRIQNFSPPTPDILNQSLYFNKMLRSSICELNFEKHSKWTGEIEKGGHKVISQPARLIEYFSPN